MGRVLVWRSEATPLVQDCDMFLWTHYLYDAPIYRLSSAFVAQRKAKVNGKNLLRKIFKALEFILNFSFMRLGIGLMLNLFYYNYATNFVLFVDFRLTNYKVKTVYLSSVLLPFCRKVK